MRPGVVYVDREIDPGVFKVTRSWANDGAPHRVDGVIEVRERGSMQRRCDLPPMCIVSAMHGCSTGAMVPYVTARGRGRGPACPIISMQKAALNDRP